MFPTPPVDTCFPKVKIDHAILFKVKGHLHIET